ncbi:MAG TPA: NAD(P)-dependent oxidoreductase [Candidatus Sumerlaeota bacterium]|nr:NAD(P)-dependent oxidoreductase [Candidatus Sumerlaeota bacterium]HPS00917.1 NAD(P)-dependent oxidoreductase [Candidatus Sumerlaeota bacterium]
MKIAVTGACGFIGRHVLADLKKHAVEVVAMLQNPAQLDLIGPGIKGVVIDIETPPSNAFELLGAPDVLIHLAWGGLPNYNSLHHMEEELPNQYRFLSGLVRSGLASLVVAGTCFEYGMLSGPLCEALITQPNNPYGYAKDALRRQLEFLRNCTPFAFTWARLFYPYGDGQSEKSLLPQLKKAVQRGDSFFNMSGGEQLRDFIPVTDVATMLVTLALHRTDIGIVNICSGKPISVRTLVEGWIREYGWSIQLNLGYYPYPDYEPMAFWGCRDKLDTVLGLT